MKKILSELIFRMGITVFDKFVLIVL